jgi:hypothetical protein
VSKFAYNSAFGYAQKPALFLYQKAPDILIANKGRVLFHVSRLKNYGAFCPIASKTDKNPTKAVDNLPI